MINTNITEARKRLFELADTAIDYNSVINISTKKGNVIMMSEDDYRGLMETAYLNAMPGMAESIIEGVKTPAEDCVELDWENELK